MILVVGGAGYIGSHVNKKLYQMNYDTLVFDNLICGHREFVKWGMFYYGDLRDIEVLERVFFDYNIDAVLHFAAYAYVGESVDNPAKYYRNNVAYTLNLLDCMVKYKVKSIIFSSSCATYGHMNKEPFTRGTFTAAG